MKTTTTTARQTITRWERARTRAAASLVGLAAVAGLVLVAVGPMAATAGALPLPGVPTITVPTLPPTSDPLGPTVTFPGVTIPPVISLPPAVTVPPTTNTTMAPPVVPPTTARPPARPPVADRTDQAAPADAEAPTTVAEDALVLQDSAVTEVAGPVQERSGRSFLRTVALVGAAGAVLLALALGIGSVVVVRRRAA